MENIALQRKVENIALQIFYMIVLRAEIVTTSGSAGSNFHTQYKKIENLRTLQGYIFRISQHFATKFWNFTTFERFFPGVLSGFA